MYADTISDLGFANELANYGEYSGAPSMEHTYEYAKTLISLMTKESNKDGKIFIIGMKHNWASSFVFGELVIYCY